LSETANDCDRCRVERNVAVARELRGRARDRTRDAAAAIVCATVWAIVSTITGDTRNHAHTDLVLDGAIVFANVITPICVFLGVTLVAIAADAIRQARALEVFESSGAHSKFAVHAFRDRIPCIRHAGAPTLRGSYPGARAVSIQS
jgi:hypothetical protein